MTILQAAAALTLWRSGRFDTYDIANVLDKPEADICRVIHSTRERERGADLHVVQGAFQ